jgi:hypothetical protein
LRSRWRGRRGEIVTDEIVGAAKAEIAKLRS